MKRETGIVIRINDKMAIPKYEQLVNEIIRNIRTGKLKIGDRVPSINHICQNFEISRDTVVIAYNELKSRGIISPIHGKGFYVASASAKSKLKIFLLFDSMNSYKEVLYRSLVNNLGNKFQVDIFFHYYNIVIFEQLIKDNHSKYGFFVIMPHFNEDVSSFIKDIPPEKILIIDKDIIDRGNLYSGVFQEFYKDIRSSLNEAIPYLKKYKKFKFIANHNFQFIPDGMADGFITFCRENKIRYSMHENLKDSMPKTSDVFLVVSDQDLIELLRTCITRDWIPGKDIGIISYDDTPLKEILAGGISVISTDFSAMGKKAADMILNGISGKFENPCNFIPRKSL